MLGDTVPKCELLVGYYRLCIEYGQELTHFPVPGMNIGHCAHQTAVDLTPTAEGNGYPHAWTHDTGSIRDGIGERSTNGQRQDHIDEHGNGRVECKGDGWLAEHRQHFADSACLVGMERKKTSSGKKETPEVIQRDYDLETPLWSKYYQQVRKSIRFPRYYKKALNW